jgi:hypothetical protein
MVMERIITVTTARAAYDKMRDAGSRLPWAEAERRLKALE